MRLVRTLLTLMMALGWAPLAAHCQVEMATGLQFLRCEAGPSASGCAESPCEQKTCCEWESGLYQAPQNAFSLHPIPIEAALLHPFDELRTPVAFEIGICMWATGPPEPPEPWQFFLRAALPIRAPSLHS